ncbi:MULTISPECIES: FeoB-associated Cys-rich membrane protein [Rhodonellum]|uniref:Virus attachment protein p12 family protein n=1 Tax=Rhodonellum ikkaensis TaxID=336829 RepID=A0A1H3NEC2_9BACT|nr:Virus attachment protein p12 family protein [Rhodonellum ikkaensis]
MWQEIIVFSLFSAVVFFWVYKTFFKSKNQVQADGCGCSKCGPKKAS